MALQIPNTPSAAGQQHATEQLDPQNHFGRAVAAPVNMPSIPAGLGGVAISPDVETAGLRQVGSALDQVTNDFERKEKLLTRGNEMFKLAENKIKYQQEVEEFKKSVLTQRDQEGLDEGQMKEVFNNNVANLRTKYFGPTLYADDEIATAAKIDGAQMEVHSRDGFVKSVIIPERTAKVLKQQNEIVNRTTQFLAQNPSVNTYADGLRTIDAIFDSPEMRTLQSPEQIESGRQRSRRELANALVEGSLLNALNFQPPPGKTMGPTEIAQAKVNYLQAAKQNFLQLAAQGYVPGINGDDIKRMSGEIDTRVSKIIDDEQRRQDHALRVQERQERLAEKATFNSYLGAMIKDPNSVTREQIVADKNMLPTTKDSLLTKLDKYQAGEGNRELLIKQTVSNIANGQSYKGAQGEDAKGLDYTYQAMRDRIKTMLKEQQDVQVAMFVTDAKWMPQTLVHELSRKLRSYDPNVQNDAITTLMQIESLERGSDRTKQPVMAKALPQDVQDMYMYVKNGYSLDAANKIRRAFDQMSNEDIAESKKRLLQRAGARNEVELKDKNTKYLNGKVKDQFDYWFSTPNTGAMTDVFDDLVSKNFARVKDLDIARELAWQSMLSTKAFGVTKLGGVERVTSMAPEQFYGLPTEVIQDAMVKDLKQFGVTKDNAILVPVPTTAQNRKYEVWMLDTATKLFEPIVPDKNKSSQVVTWHYAPTKEHIEAAKAAEEQRIAEAKAKRDAFLSGTSSFDSLLKPLLPTPKAAPVNKREVTGKIAQNNNE